MTKPLMVSARGMRCSPTHPIIDAVIRSMPPVCLSASARIDPRTITTAMLWIVRPNPCSNAAMNARRSMPGSQREEQDRHEERDEDVPLEPRDE